MGRQSVAVSDAGVPRAGRPCSGHVLFMPGGGTPSYTHDQPTVAFRPPGSTQPWHLGPRESPKSESASGLARQELSRFRCGSGMDDPSRNV